MPETNVPGSFWGLLPAPEPPQRLRSLKWGLGALAIIVIAYRTLFWPRWTHVQVPSGEAYDVIRVSRDASVGQMFGPRVAALGEAVRIKYYAVKGGKKEAEKLLPLLMPLASRTGDSVIVVDQTATPLTRWVPYETGRMILFRRNESGGWDFVR